ncbi:MAG TPA: hypothetical protein VMG10_14320 [Gemmataceae bacterium]|nr:hypothetical protein [Gemmataceae bacterium]
MSRKSTVSQSAPANNGEVDPRDDFPFGANASADESEIEDAGPEGVSPPTKPTNPFSREALRLDNNYAALLKTETHQHSIAVDKPPSEVWFRVHPDRNEDGEEFFFDTYLLHLKNGPDRGVYQVSADLLPYLSGEKSLKPTRLVLCIDRQGELRLWPLRLPGPDGREDDWMSSALAIAEKAKQQWVRLIAGANGYKSQTTSADLPEPVWPTQTFDEILDIAFAKRRIAKESDPILRRLREGV